MKNHEEYQKIMQFEEMNRKAMINPSKMRQSNPTNLSINLAGQSIVAN